MVSVRLLRVKRSVRLGTCRGPVEPTVLLAVFTSLAGCFLDTAGQGQDAVGASSTEGGGGAAGGAGGSGGDSAVCGNGVLEAGEACEDYNDQADTCVSCRFAGSCGDGVIGGGEECDGDARFECTESCTFGAGMCSELPLLEQGSVEAEQTEMPDGAIFGKPAVQSCSTDAQGAWLFRFETGPYPRGFVTYLDGDGVSPLLFTTLGCGSEMLSCQRGNDPLLVATPIFSPGTIVFGGIADEDGAPDTISGRVRYHRFFEPFVENPVAWEVDTRFQWDPDAEELYLTETGSSTPTAFTPPVFVGGLQRVEVGVSYDFHGRPDCDVNVIASLDDGAPTVVGTLPTAERYVEVVFELGPAVKLVTGLQADIRGACDFDLETFAVLEPFDP